MRLTLSLTAFIGFISVSVARSADDKLV